MKKPQRKGRYPRPLSRRLLKTLAKGRREPADLPTDRLTALAADALRRRWVSTDRFANSAHAPPGGLLGPVAEVLDTNADDLAEKFDTAAEETDDQAVVDACRVFAALARDEEPPSAAARRVIERAE